MLREGPRPVWFVSRPLWERHLCRPSKSLLVHQPSISRTALLIRWLRAAIWSCPSSQALRRPLAGSSVLMATAQSNHNLYEDPSTDGPNRPIARNLGSTEYVEMSAVGSVHTSDDIEDHAVRHKRTGRSHFS